MKKKAKCVNTYDVVYKTKSGRLMVAKKVCGDNANDAKKNLQKEMRASDSFDKVITATKL